MGSNCIRQDRRLFHGRNIMKDVDSEILPIVQEDNTPLDPEAQLMAEAIGVFKRRMKRVSELFLEPLEM